MNNLIPPPKVLGFFLTVHTIEGDSITGRSIEDLREEFEGIHGWLRVRRFKKHQIQRLFKVWGSGYIGVVELG